MMKLYLKSTLCLTLIFLTSTYTHAETASGASASMVRMAPAKKIPLPTYLKYFENILKKRDLTAMEKDNQTLAIFALEVVEVESVTCYNDDPSMVVTASIVQAIYDKLTKTPLWDDPISAEKINKITKVKVTLLKIFGPKYYVWAWVQNALGEKEEARKILLESFEEHYTMTMKSTVTYGGPFTQAELILSALSPMCDKVKNNELNTKLKEMKVHVSKLPNAMIMT